ncbi:RsmB/NOP family class I SAM-dependent RNA methyltransferase [Rhodoligotrophos defluvii]|uniref:RsmB/NOP family class I SAM-dependent RNA methyltransferase n=1 Tax=Rhodoligotrophos defluvii TaxID=2561934 RepID=UPI0010C943AA|nr:RsmB/NOP family class I SAM-dependent RNA methyltransferase [Rhodoligotrophos defluvii]
MPSPNRRSATAAEPDKGGLLIRSEAARLLGAVLFKQQPLDDLLNESLERRAASLNGRDRALLRAIVATALRRKGQIDALVDRFLTRGRPKHYDLLQPLLLVAAAQLLFMRVAHHAAIDTAVTLIGQSRPINHLKGLANAVLRRMSREGPALLASQDDARLNTPDWLWNRWLGHYGEAETRAIAEAHIQEPPLDLTPRDGDAASLADRLGGTALPTGTVRLTEHHGRVEALEGYAAGEWWVQDAAAALPARLLGDVGGKRVIDLCAAPGGKTLQLAAAGAHVTAVDLSEPRLARVRDNLARTGLAAEVVCADATAFSTEQPADAVLLDAPCSATGTIRRHPDIPYTKTAEQLTALSALQDRLLRQAVALTKPGGIIVYCTCSLEPEEGEARVEAALDEGLPVERLPIQPEEIGGLARAITPAGDLRTLPSIMLDEERGIRGLDGFYACRLVRH